MQKSHWIITSKSPTFPKLSRNISVDVAIIGAGITGITAAYLLNRAGKKVALLERDHVLQGDTAHTTAHLTCVTDLRLHDAVAHFGRDHARALWDSGVAAIDLIEETIKREKIACEFRRVPGYLHAPAGSPKAAKTPDLRKDAQLAAELGFDATFLASVPFFHRPGMRIGNQAKFHPLKYLSGLLKKLKSTGGKIFENSEVKEFSAEPLAVKVDNHTVRANYLVIATHVPLMGNTNLPAATLFQTKLAPYSSYAIGATLPRASLPEALFWDTADPYHYLRVDALPDHDYLIFGGEDHKTGQVTDTESCYQRLETQLRALIKNVKIKERWSGQVVETNDGIPLIGESADHQFIATGFAGNGMTFGTLAGMMACDAALGRNSPWKKLFNVHRKKVFGGTWDYIKENVDYAYYLVKDRLTKSEGQSARSIKPGEGKILKRHGQRLAVYRDDSGKLSTVSATCTHMGCLVHWNNAEKTWDCPCHGSRFKPSGEVIAGPAEDPLKPVQSAKKAKSK